MKLRYVHGKEKKEIEWKGEGREGKVHQLGDTRNEWCIVIRMIMNGIDGWMDKWINEWMNEWMDEWTLPTMTAGSIRTRREPWLSEGCYTSPQVARDSTYW